MGIALGLLAALSWGLADYFAAIASRQVGALRVVLGFHVVATLLLGVLVVLTDADLAAASSRDLLWFVLLGALGWLSYVSFYRALAIGPISIVSPVVSAYAAVTVLCAVVISGERLSGGEIAAVVVAMCGVMLASSDLAQLGRLERTAALGIGLALVTAAFIGAFVFGVAYFSTDYGWLVPIFLARAFSTVFVAGMAGVTGEWHFAGVPRRVLGWIVLVAVVDTTGYVAFSLGIRHADTTVVATASAPYAVVPIVAGVLLLAERPAPIQWGGVGLVIAGLVLLGLSA
jgi:drug/metabolite transporter (DMT)-like permease